MMYAVILAGGSGTRLWPRSREQWPKQFLDLGSGRTMLQEAVERIEPLIPLHRVYVITNRDYVGIVREQVPALPASNVIGEIAGRGTAPAVGLAAIMLRRVDPEAIMAVLTADHWIAARERFRQALQAAAEVAARGYLVTLGIRTERPETGYGYIERGEPLERAGDFEVYRVARFIEKPDLETARAFVQSGRHVWNSGMFIWRVHHILAEIERLMPDLYAQLHEIEAYLGTPREEETLQRIWPQIARQTIDYGVMERARDVAVIPVDIGWSDIGSWATLLDLLPADEHGNVLTGEVELIDVHHSLIYSPKRLIAAIGMENMIIVDAGDALLICPKERAQEVRNIVERLQCQGKDRYIKYVPKE